MRNFQAIVPPLCAVAALCSGSTSAFAKQIVRYESTTHGPPAGVVRASNDAVATCDVIAATDTSSQSVEVVASVAASTSAHVCNQNSTMSEADFRKQSREIALATAESFARAVASISVDCYLSGQATVKIDGRSIAMSSAHSIAQAYVKAIAEADVCDGCEATATLVAEQNEELFLTAVAIAEVQVISSTTSGTTRGIWIEEFVENVITGTASAFAQALVGSFGSTEGGCQAFVAGSAVVDANAQDDRGASSFNCTVNVTALDYAFAESVVANASRESAIYACEEPTDEQANVTAREIATAVASAIASVSLQCEVPTSEHTSGSGVVCASGAAQAMAVAEASAYVWAEGWVRALADCEESLCVASAGNIASEISTIMVNAHTSAVDAACAGNNETFEITTVTSETVTDSLAAVAEVLLSARITWYGQECSAASEVSAYIIGTPTPGRVPNPLPTLPANVSDALSFPLVVPTVVSSNDSLTAEGSATEMAGSAPPGTVANGTSMEFTETVVALQPCGEGPCVTNYGQCFGEFRGVVLGEPLPCCGRVFECVKASSVYGLCMPKGQKAPPDWDGEVIAGYCGY